MPAPVSALLGSALGGVVAAIRAVRHPRPIHPHGVVLDGAIRWTGQRRRSGIEWIDDPEPGDLRVTARVSRAAGLPPALPDVVGLAFRFDTARGAADVELSSTGLGVPSRYVLLPHWVPSRARMTSILPYRGTDGPVLLAALPVSPAVLPAAPRDLAAALRDEPWRLRLCFATPMGRWYPFAELVLRTAADQDDRGLRFDAVRRMVPGGAAYDWVRRIREPGYRAAQRRQARSSHNAAVARAASRS